MPETREFNVKQVRQDFPNLAVNVRGKPLVYLDNAATTLKPQSVIDSLTDHYQTTTSNVHRGVHFLSEKATADYENARAKVQNFINAPSSDEIIFTSGTTDALNLLMQSYGRAFINQGDEILITEMEHHSNIVPWQMLCEEIGCILRVAPMNDQGELIYEEFTKLLTNKVKLVSVIYISNSLGTINPIKKIIDDAHKLNIPVIVDGAQAVSHTTIDVQALDCDFFAFSAHKLFGPTGVGVLFGKAELLNKMPPYRGGGDMIASVTFEKTTYNKLPYKFEAGTPNIADVIGLGAAIDYISSIGVNNTQSHRSTLLKYATEQLQTIEKIQLIGTAKEKASVVSFIHPDIHAHDMGTLLDQEGVAIRTGHHCTQPVMKHFNIPATSRASFALYNTQEEIDQLISAIKKAEEIFK